GLCSASIAARSHSKWYWNPYVRSPARNACTRQWSLDASSVTPAGRFVTSWLWHWNCRESHGTPARIVSVCPRTPIRPPVNPHPRAPLLALRRGSDLSPQRVRHQLVPQAHPYQRHLPPVRFLQIINLRLHPGVLRQFSDVRAPPQRHHPLDIVEVRRHMRIGP